MPVKGARFTPEHRAKLSAARRRRPPPSEETRAKMRASMLGFRHTSETKEAIRQARLLAGPHSERRIRNIRAALAAVAPEKKEQQRRKVSATMKRRGTSRGRRNPWFGKNTLHGPRTHWVEHRGVKMRSSWERRFAQALDCRGVEWAYEPRRFDLGEVTYLPDFYVPEFGAYVEIKGWLDPNSQRRIELFRKKHPELPLIVVDGPLLRQFETSFVGD